MIVSTVKTNDFDNLHELIEDTIMDYKNDMGLTLKHICYSSHFRMDLEEGAQEVYTAVMIFE